MSIGGNGHTATLPTVPASRTEYNQQGPLSTLVAKRVTYFVRSSARRRLASTRRDTGQTDEPRLRNPNADLAEGRNYTGLPSILRERAKERLLSQVRTRIAAAARANAGGYAAAMAVQCLPPGARPLSSRWGRRVLLHRPRGPPHFLASFHSSPMPHACTLVAFLQGAPNWHM